MDTIKSDVSAFLYSDVGMFLSALLILGLPLCLVYVGAAGGLAGAGAGAGFEFAGLALLRF